MMKLSLVMPAYNEARTLAEIVEKVETILAKIDFELVLVDDGSKDNTLEVANNLAKKYSNIHVIEHEKNKGKSQTVKTGILASKGEYVVIQDADMEYNPADILLLLEKIENEKLDVVYGNRFGKNHDIIYLQNYLGNTFLSIISAIFTGLRANMWPRDMEVCYKMAKGDLFRKLAEGLTATSNFGFEPEITAKFAQVKGIKFGQVPVHYYPRTIEEGKHMKAFQDGFKALNEIYIYNLPAGLRSFILYILIGFTGLTLDFLSFLAMINWLHVNPLIANPISMSVGIINNFFLNAHFNFKKTDNILVRLASFYVVGLIGILISNLFIAFFNGYLHLEIVPVKAVSVILIAVIQYFLNKAISFRTNNETQNTVNSVNKV